MFNVNRKRMVGEGKLRSELLFPTALLRSESGVVRPGIQNNSVMCSGVAFVAAMEFSLPPA